MSHFGPLLLLAAATLCIHGWSLFDGLFLDDHWHRLQFEQRGWSIPDMLDAATIQPDRFMQHWWQTKSISWQYTRPVSMALMKLVHDISGGSVVAQHAVSVTLHLASVLMVYALSFMLTRSRLWSTVAGSIFAAYSHANIAVAWLAAQNSILQTALTLAAMLLYIRASGLNLFPYGDFAGTELGRASKLRWIAFGGCLLLWCAALLSRENALALPIIAVALDLAFGGTRRLRARLAPYAAFALVAGTFAFWRLALQYHPMPDVYVRRFDGPEYLPWLAAKLMHYLCSAVWLSPMTIGPSGRYNPFTETPGDCALMLVILAVMGGGYYLACRKARGFWIWPLWILLAILPVVPVMATPHTGYMPGVGFAVAMVLGPALRKHVQPVSIGRWSPVVATWFLIATHTYIPIYRSMWKSMVAAEGVTITQITAFPPASAAKEAFFINLPFVNIYAQLCLAEKLGAKNLRCHALTYSPDLLRASQPLHIRQLDDHRFSVRIDGRPYFSGYLGRFLVDGMGRTAQFRAAERVAGEFFDVQITDASPAGVSEIIFSFHQRLDSPQFAFYASTPDCAAARVLFRGPAEPIQPTTAEIAYTSNELASFRDTREALYSIRQIASTIIRTDLYLTGPPFPGPK